MALRKFTANGLEFRVHVLQLWEVTLNPVTLNPLWRRSPQVRVLGAACGAHNASPTWRGLEFEALGFRAWSYPRLLEKGQDAKAFNPFCMVLWVLELGLRDPGLGCEERLKILGFTTGVGDVLPQASVLFPHLNHTPALQHRHSGPLHKRTHLQMVVTLCWGG